MFVELISPKQLKIDYENNHNWTLTLVWAFPFKMGTESLPQTPSFSLPSGPCSIQSGLFSPAWKDQEVKATEEPSLTVFCLLLGFYAPLAAFPSCHFDAKSKTCCWPFTSGPAEKNIQILWQANFPAIERSFQVGPVIPVVVQVLLFKCEIAVYSPW